MCLMFVIWGQIDWKSWFWKIWVEIDEIGLLFLYPSCSFAVISFIIFTHNMHTLCYIRYPTWSKNWLINFWAMYFLVYAFFMCELLKIFFLRDMMDNQCANIFSTHVTVYGSHNGKFAFIEREYFSSCVSST